MTAAVLLAFLVSPFQVEADLVESWSRTKPGAWVRLDGTEKIADAGKAAVTRRIEVKEVTADWIQLAVVETRGRTEQSEALKVPAKVAAVEWKDKGEETLTIDGRKLTCTVREHRTKDGTTVTAFHTKDTDVCRGYLKWIETRKLDTGTFTRTRVVASLSKKVKVPKGEFECWQVESSTTGPAQSVSAVE